MRQLDLVILSALSFRSINAADLPRPRGVGPEFAKYYKDSTNFACISAPSVRLPVSRVNDDFCDCPDGSDEPGTAACSHLSPLSPHALGDVIVDPTLNQTPSLPGFYCKNKGHQPSYIPFNLLNDGVCDHSLCCDGSDEWAHVGGTKCEDKCKEIGAEWRKNDEQRQKSMGMALKRQKELASEASKLRDEVAVRVQDLEVQVQAAEMKIKGLEDEVQKVERQERGKVVRKPKEGGKLGVLVQLAKDRTTELREALLEVRGQRDSGRTRLEELEGIMRTFHEEYNPNFNDEGVKRAVRAWEEYVAKDKHDSGNEARDRDLEEIARSEEEAGIIKWSEFQEAEESDIDVLYKFEAYLPKSVRDWLDQKLRDFRLLLIENGILASSHDPNAETPALATARSSLKSAQDGLNSDRNSLDSQRNDLTKDYGPADIFRALNGNCVEKDSGEYTYEICFMSSTKQKSKKGGGQTVMGNFVGFDRITTDEEVPVDGKGVGKGERLVMKYENGQHCWNGPNRSTMVVLACSETEELWRVVEEEKCVYRMEVGTAAVCGGAGVKSADASEGARVKDEL